MVAFASSEWIAEFNTVLSVLDVHGPGLRVRYRFPAEDGSTTERGYDLVFGHGVMAELPPRQADSDPMDTPVVTIVQPTPVAQDVAAGRLAAQQALLDGRVEVSGPVTELLAWGDTLSRIDALTGGLRARTNWS